MAALALLLLAGGGQVLDGAGLEQLVLPGEGILVLGVGHLAGAGREHLGKINRFDSKHEWNLLLLYLLCLLEVLHLLQLPRPVHVEVGQGGAQTVLVHEVVDLQRFGAQAGLERERNTRVRGASGNKRQ